MEHDDSFYHFHSLSSAFLHVLTLQPSQFRKEQINYEFAGDEKPTKAIRLKSSIFRTFLLHVEFELICVY